MDNRNHLPALPGNQFSAQKQDGLAERSGPSQGASVGAEPRLGEGGTCVLRLLMVFWRNPVSRSRACQAKVPGQVVNSTGLLGPLESLLEEVW